MLFVARKDGLRQSDMMVAVVEQMASGRGAEHGHANMDNDAFELIMCHLDNDARDGGAATATVIEKTIQFDVHCSSIYGRVGIDGASLVDGSSNDDPVRCRSVSGFCTFVDGCVLDTESPKIVFQRIQRERRNVK